MSPSMSQKSFLYLTGVSEGSLLCVGLLLGWLLGIPVWSKIIFSFTDIVLGTALALVMAILAIGTLRSNWAIFSQLKKDTQQVIKLLSNMGLGSIIIVSVAAGVCEEVLFRGVLQIALSDWFGMTTGLLLASLLFGLAHMISVSYVIYVSAFGLVLGAMYMWTGNLLGPIIAHFIYDLLMLYWALYVQWPASAD